MGWLIIIVKESQCITTFVNKNKTVHVIFKFQLKRNRNEYK